MNVLITNDDGYEAEGINVIAKELSAAGHKVYILAPLSNRSAVSHCISMHNHLELKKIDDNVWASSGYPADCVITAITSNVFENIKFDLVISGINRGPNVGTDIIYSGTCAGARQGALLNIPSIALSVNSEDGKFCATSIFDYKSLALFVKNNIEKLIEIVTKSEKKVFLNVNAPSVKVFKGVKLCNLLCKRYYNDYIDVVPTENNNVFKSQFVMGNGTTDTSFEEDLGAINEGYIAISTILVEPIASNPSEILDCNSFSV